MRRRIIRVGLIGCGNVAMKRHLPVLTTMPDADVVAVADANPEQLEHVERKFHVRKAYRDYFELLADSESNLQSLPV